MRSLITLGAFVTLVGCTVENPDLPDAEVRESTTASALIVVERGSGADAIVARFVRVRQGMVDDLALRTAGVQDLPAADTCVSSFEAPSSPARTVELLDVGTVTWDSHAQSTVLLPRSLPDPAGMVSGYFYTARTSDALAAAAGSSRISLRASGGADLPEGFTVSFAAPRELGDVLVSPSAGNLEVSWDSSDADPRDLVYVDVLAPNVVARCAANDAGRLTLPASVLGDVDDGTLAVHRVHREAFKTRGIDPGEVRFDLARTVPFRR